MKKILLLLVFLLSLSKSYSLLPIDKEEITPSTWRSLTLEYSKVEGGKVDISLLRPNWWIKQARAEVGKSIYLSLPEMHVRGHAKVINIGECKADSRNQPKGQQLITGTFKHISAEVYDLKFDGIDKLLSVTGNHLLWSEDQDSWIEALKLKIGEKVRTKEGSTTLLVRKKRKALTPVYNLEVHKDHNYYVSNLSILAHNQCDVPVRKQIKEAVQKAHQKLGNPDLTKGARGKFGSPQYTNGKKGIRLDPPHPGRPAGHPESGWHINYWDYTGGKRKSGGIEGVIPIK